jgi:predicted aminopeptidase
LDAKQWCYPIIGCASYRGYFSQADAERYATRLSTAGLDTSIGAVGAYSTLGWFDDPLIPSMMRYGVADFAETMFHELAHQQLYINGDSGFNEAFATVVGEQGALQWIAEQRPELLADYQARLKARDDFSGLIENFTQRLDKLYSSNWHDDREVDVEQLREAKNLLFANLRHQYELLKQNRWSGKSWYDQWFEQEINNAKIVAFGTYRAKVPAFETLLTDCGLNFDTFYRSIESAEQVSFVTDIPTQCLR